MANRYYPQAVVNAAAKAINWEPVALAEWWRNNVAIVEGVVRYATEQPSTLDWEITNAASAMDANKTPLYPYLARVAAASDPGAAVIRALAIAVATGRILSVDDGS